MPRIDFWHELGSSYSYPAAVRIEAAAAKAGVAVRWRPFLLGPIFKAQGWPDTPFNLLPAKGRYMWRDLERICGGLGIAFRRPDPFPQNSVLAARVALIGHDEGWGTAFTTAVYNAEFAEGGNIGERPVLATILGELGQDAVRVFALAESDANRLRLRAETEAAQSLGIFGAPSFTAEDGELFWGNDRLEQALAWADERGARRSP
jgi:2-hydroxychromene-2-carboxylate isomerase